MTQETKLNEGQTNDKKEFVHKHLKSTFTIDFEDDYIRAIDYSPNLGLFSISDNGYARLYDVTKDTIVSILKTPTTFD